MRFEVSGDTLCVHAPAKINLHLEVGPPRSDGFHDIDSLFLSVSLFDRIEFAPGPDGEIALECAGMPANEENLVWRAATLLRSVGAGGGAARGGPSRGARIRLEKTIPAGAGLGGGSSDAAATLLALDQLWNLELGATRLAPLAAELGSDVPYFLSGGLARCRGRGEDVRAWGGPAAVASPAFTLACPRLSVDTKEAYGDLDRSRDPNFNLTLGSVLDRLESPPFESVASPDAPARSLFNHFESVVYARKPELAELHARLSRHDIRPERVFLTGTGSTVVAAFRSEGEANRCAAAIEAERGDSLRAYSVVGLPAWHAD